MVTLIREFRIVAGEATYPLQLTGGRLDKDLLWAQQTPLLSVSKIGGTSWLLSTDFHDGGLAAGPRKTALKILQPTDDREIANRAEKEFHREVTVLTRLQHPNIVKYLASGKCNVTVNVNGTAQDKSSLYYFLEFESGFSISELRNTPKKLNLGEVCEVIEGVLDAVKHMHDSGIAHLDIHAANVLVDGSRAVLIDFGKAVFAGDKYPQNRGEDYPNGKTFIGEPAAMYSNAMAHPQLKELFEQFKKQQAKGKADEEDIQQKFRSLMTSAHFPRFDLYSLASTLSVLVNSSVLVTTKEQTPVREALKLVLSNLREKNQNEIVGYGASAAKESIIQIRTSIGEGDIRLIRLAGGANVRIREKFSQVVDTPQFQRLRGVAQLSLTSLIYPSATHSRFSHSLGAFDLAGRYVNSLIRNSSECRIGISAAVRDDIQMAALVHDIGHYPFAHYFEEMMETEAGANESVIRFYPSVGGRLNFHHEELGRKLRAGEIDFPGASEKDVKLLHDELFDLDRRLNEHPLGRVFSDVISGPLDCDKVDYLIRDGISCGVPYASSIDVERLLAALTIGKVASPPSSPYQLRKGNSDNRPLLMISEKGIAPAESILAARYQMFSEVYWHKVARAMAAMLKQALSMVLSEGTMTQDGFWKVVVNANDADLLTWLRTELHQIKPNAAKHLVGTLIQHRSIYKRVLTLSADWERQGSKGEEVADTGTVYGCTLNTVSIIVSGRLETSFRKVQCLQEELRKIVSSKLAVQIEPWEILLDVPPGHAKEEKYPYVAYKNFSSETKRLNEVSGLLTNTSKDKRTTTLLAGSHRIRVFVRNELIDDLKRAALAKTEDEGKLDLVILRCLREYLEKRPST